MKKFTFPLLFCFILSFSCIEDQDPETICGVTDPLTNLSWLKTLQENYASDEMSEYNYIGQAIYEGQTVFYLASCCPNCNWQLITYDCSGNKIEEDHTLDDLDSKQTIWKSEDSECVFDE
ncbi:hypothetical protein [Cyclobacterium marinum]|uniref:Lipoprotein n=1 Tax=Cyclobacterium marinum (strain ATCC 25205 / DSM 745 / LMG 13164 / NCIMB 1802) TaxID=880070 RepID=G0IX63_CYCMS|nr:hypothetical protein [Cyclobacterium marinum]AEL25611.1 hypothetical protein Cycma_1859 [Cyclobacterium marinum DSM 745]